MPQLASRQRRVESVAPALALLAREERAKMVAAQMGVSAATILNWMDWAWKRRAQIEPYLRQNYPSVTPDEWDRLWERIARRQARRQRRFDFASLLARE